MASCVYKLKLGKPLHVLVPGRGMGKVSAAYEVCITRTQHERLFGACDPVCQPPVALGCGKYACAYPHRDAAKVVKITHDEADVAALLRGQEVSDRVVKTFGIHKLESPVAARFLKPGTYYKRAPRGGLWPKHPGFDVFAIEAERLSPLPKEWYKRVNCVGDVTRAWGPNKTLSKYDVKRLVACCPKSGSKAKHQACRRVVRDITRTKLALGKVGVRWFDIHQGNVGVDAHGRWKALDLGTVSAQIEDVIDELRGRR
jgi:hypothetical protein